MSASLPSTMRAVMLLGPERVEVRDVPVPRPKRGELVINVRAALTCGTDVKVFRRGGHPRMLTPPTLFGHEMSGTVAAIGRNVEKFEVGDRVVVANSASCGGCDYCAGGRENLCRELRYLNGAFAEFLLVPAEFVTRSTYSIPPQLPFEQAAMTEPLACVLHGVDACDLERQTGGESAEIIVYGAGPIGLLFVAVLSHQGHRVILADPNAPRLAVGKALGAGACVQVTRDGGSLSRLLACTRNGEGAHVAVDCTGVPEVWEAALDSVRPGGLVNFFGGCAPGSEVTLDTHRTHYSELTVKGVYHHRPADVRQALELLADKRIDVRRLIDGECAIEEVEQALRKMIRRESLKFLIRQA